MTRRGSGWSVFASVVLVAILGLCLSRLAGDWRAYESAQSIKDAKIAELKGLKRERDLLRQRAEDLRNDPATKERLVRSMGYIKPGEKVYLLQADKEDAVNPTSAPSSFDSQ